MRILYLTPGCFDKGGISRYSRYQISAWRDIIGTDSVSVLSLLGPTSDSFEVPFQVSWCAGGCSPQSKGAFIAQSIASGLRDRPQFIHSAHVNLSGLALSVARLIGARSIVNVYGLEVWSGMRPDARFGLSRSDLMISDCHWTERYVTENGLRAAGATRVIWDCVDVDRFSPGACSNEILVRYGIPDPETGINVLTLGRLSRDAAHKGYERLLHAFAGISAQVPSLRLVYAGAGALAEDLRQSARQMGLEDRVFFTGSVHENDLPQVYRSAHVFSLISDRGSGRGEGVPLTPLEAASCGVPILVGNEDGSQEAVEANLNGRVLSPKDLEAQSAALLELATNIELRRQMGVGARRRIIEMFSYPTFREKHRALIDA